MRWPYRPRRASWPSAVMAPRGTLGDIALLDPLRGAVAKVQEEHRQTIMSLGFSASGKSLASMDRGGRLLVWPADGGKPRVLAAPDVEVHGPAAAQAIAASLRLRPSRLPATSG